MTIEADFRASCYFEGDAMLAEAAPILRRLLASERFEKTFLPLPIAAPTVTLLTARGAYADMIAEGQGHIGADLPIVSVVGGFVFSDAPEARISILGYGHGLGPKTLALDLDRYAWAERERFRVRLTPRDDAIARIHAAGRTGKRTAVCLADVADNPGGGGRGNTTHILERILAAGVERVLLGNFVDPAAAAKCHAAGVGARIALTLNEGRADAHARAIPVDLEVLALSDGAIVGRAGVVAGRTTHLESAAAVRIGSLSMVVCSRRVQCADPAYFESLGLDDSSICAHEKLVAFPCKRQGLCPSCGARRMAETAARLVDPALALPPGRSPGTNSPPDYLCPGSAYRIALGPRAEQNVLSLRTGDGRDEKITRGLCPGAHGFTLHAAVRCGADQRQQLEQLCRYITRPALANERLSRNAKGRVVLKLKSPYRDGTTHIVMQPQEFTQRLAALVRRPRLHLIRFHGVLAPHAKLRAAVIPQPAQKDSAPAHEHAHGNAARMRWAQRLKRAFGIDVERCECGGKLKIIDAIEEPTVIERILTHFGLSAQPPPRSPARRVELVQPA